MSAHSLGGDVVVVGAGLIGLALAFELAERGASVRVYDRDEPGRGASWAGAGMLAPHSEVIDDAAMRELCEVSLAEYPAFAGRVEAASGIDVKLHVNGVVHAAFDEDQVGALRTHAETLAARGVRCSMLDRAAALSLEPSLGSHLCGGLLIHDEGCVDNRRLGRALTSACVARGVSIVCDAKELAVSCDERRVLGVRTHHGFASAVHVVNATGAWAAHLSGVPAVAAPPVLPVKGEILALAMPRGFVRRPTWIPGAYFVPRDDGRLLIGATMESGGFNTRVTAAGIHALLDAALKAAPAMRDFALVETWAGLRPGSPDGRPFLGPTPVEGLWLATGHFRNGILLAPASARLIADALASGGEHSATLAPFALGRLQKAEETETVATTRISVP